MSLKVKVKNEYPKSEIINTATIIRDVEAAYQALKIDSPNISSIISKLENGEYLGESTFKDQFGRYLDTEYLSTGTKAILLLDHFANINTEVEIYFTEVGNSHYNYAISNYSSGCICIPRLKKIYESDTSLDVEINEIKVNSINEYNKVIAKFQ